VSTATFRPCGVITLTTDFGHKGPFVATMKGVMLTRFGAARIIDLSHETTVHFPAEAGFWLTRAYPYFPPGTVHVAVVDPGVGTERDIIAVDYDGHVFLAPDNGLLAALAERPLARVFRLDLSRSAALGIGSVSATFHGRDIFAPIGAALASGELSPEALGTLTTTVVPSWVEEPLASGGRLGGTVVAVDNFGNLITNISAEHMARFRRPRVRAGGRSFALHRTYGEVSPGEYLALINSFGMLELARAEQSAAEGLGLGRSAPVVVSEADTSSRPPPSDP
jgi:S-adenosylmethionine hydrolase